MAPRLEKYRKEEMSPEQRVIYDAIATGPRAARPQIFPMVDAEGLLEGPWNAWLINPVLGTALEVMGSSYHVGLASITLRCREIATLIIGRTLNCEFELYAHIRVARANGVTEEEISDILEGRAHTFEDEVEQVIFDTVPLLLKNQDLDDAQYARAEALLGLQGMFALVWMTSWYWMMALQLNVFRVPLPEGHTVGS
jgi:4-carboxymuconolactone decarboxylase